MCIQKCTVDSAWQLTTDYQLSRYMTRWCMSWYMHYLVMNVHTFPHWVLLFLNWRHFNSLPTDIILCVLNVQVKILYNACVFVCSPSISGWCQRPTMVVLLLRGLFLFSHFILGRKGEVFSWDWNAACSTLLSALADQSSNLLLSICMVPAALQAQYCPNHTAHGTVSQSVNDARDLSC